nr:beta-3-deoxy-D-manno-oct-2-ulosonic acid transferase [uncultured Desulfobulbus sp.]
MGNLTDSPQLYALDFSSWKRPMVRCCFPEAQIHFVSDASQVPSGGTVIIWGMRSFSGVLPNNVEIIRVEDGFLRSVGLGADLIRPMSWVIDRRGIYYDATQPSDVEHILSSTDFTSELLERAARFRDQIVQQGLTKYNIGANHWQRPTTKKRIILVPGQVESDASLAYGAPGIRTNLALLQAVREKNPDAYIIYKPHPDVIAGLRAQGNSEHEAISWCDQLVINVDMSTILPQVDEVHILTSLAGFEALLREKPVTCYGQPFYSGWGLTQDIFPHERRSRNLSLNALVAGALLLYPCYLNRTSDELISAEAAMEQLLDWRNQTGQNTPWWRHLTRFFIRRIVGVR